MLRMHIIISYHIISYHIVDLKRQNRLKVGTNKHKLKVTMQSVSDDDVLKRLLELNASNLEQISDLLCLQTNLAFWPQWVTGSVIE